MSSLRPTVLIFAYAEYGQANINLATAYELALAGVNVYIASFAPLRTRVERLQELVIRHTSRSNGRPTGSVNFHECKSIAPLDALWKMGTNDVDRSHPPGVFGAVKSYSIMDITNLSPYSLEEYIAGIEDCKEIIAIIKPNTVLVELLFNVAFDACRLVNQKFMLITPFSIHEYAVGRQPGLAAIWKYPAASSAFPFPLKWWQIPLNIYLNIRLIIQSMTSVKAKELRALRISLGLEPAFGILGDQLHSGATKISPALVETDLPFAVIPEDLCLCGPIILPFDPLEETDPALKKWLDNAPTVMVNLGTLRISDGGAAREMASAFRILLDFHDRNGAGKIQVLWKLKASEDMQTVIDEIIGKEIQEGRVKVLPWLETEPVSVLQHPNVVCMVHHGGANSFFEGIWSGIPHIVLPAWYDTYDFANRVEFLNVGIFANKTCAPSVRAEEFGKALVRVTGNTEEATNFRRSAKHLKEICRAKGSGRELACMAVLKEIGIGK